MRRLGNKIAIRAAEILDLLNRADFYGIELSEALVKGVVSSKWFRLSTRNFCSTFADSPL